MITTDKLTLNEIRQIGLEILAEKLGPVGMIRFIQQFELGQGNYTLEREQWLNEPNVKTLAQKIRQHVTANQLPITA